MACDYQDCTETKTKRPNYAVFLMFLIKLTVLRLYEITKLFRDSQESLKTRLILTKLWLGIKKPIGYVFIKRTYHWNTRHGKSLSKWRNYLVRK